MQPKRSNARKREVRRVQRFVVLNEALDFKFAFATISTLFYQKLYFLLLFKKINFKNSLKHAIRRRKQA